MSLSEKILMPKIKNKEKQKLKLLQNKHDGIKMSNEDADQLTNEVKKRKKRALDLDETSVNRKKFKVEVNDSETCKYENDITETIKKEQKTNLKDVITRNFESLNGFVSEKTLKAVTEMGFTTMTDIQFETMPALLEGKDLVGRAKTGSGKTLAFLIPAVELVHKLRFKHIDGTGVIIITPTRELSLQTFSVLEKLMTYHHNTYGLVMGGADRATETMKLSNGINILVATPGRLLDHLKTTPKFIFKNLQCLIIDEVDKLLAIGFETEMKQILNMLPKKRQTMLFSATQSKKTDILKKLVFKRQSPLYVEVGDIKAESTVKGLQQGFVTCPLELRLQLLCNFLKKHRKKKVMVFFSSCNSVEYHYKLFNYIELPVMCIHGKQKQDLRTRTFFEFSNAESGTLLCTDVAARGLDIPVVDWIVQYDLSEDPKEYIHRVGRTARGGTSGNAILILMPHELIYLLSLHEAKIPLNEYNISSFKLSDIIQMRLEEVIDTNASLQNLARDAYFSYIKSYESRRSKVVFDVKLLDLNKLAHSFALKSQPYSKNQKKGQRKHKKGNGTIINSTQNR